MPSDYEQITKDNIRRRGEEFDDIGRFLSEQLYSDRSHFVFELLQNAEDALGRRFKSDPSGGFPCGVRFRLYKNRLEFSHFGQPFDMEDVKAISDILKGTKRGDLNQIGKFGIGFKSIYAFTTAPEIHSGGEHFRIERYIRLENTPVIQGIEKDGTLFVFPFVHEQVEPQESFRLIHEKLGKLGPTVLLFLNWVNEIEWIAEGGQGGRYIKDVVPYESHPMASKVTLIGWNNGEEQKEEWILFRRELSPGTSHGAIRAELAFKLVRGAEGHSITKVKESHLVVFFPTEKDTRLGFLINGPYRTTPARDNIPQDDEWNKWLIRETAALLGESLSTLKEMGFISIAFLETLPIRVDAFPEGGMFRPFFDEVLSSLAQKHLLPSDGMEFVSTSEAKLARGADLRALLNPGQLQDFFASDHPLHWLHPQITAHNTPELRSYLMSQHGVEEISPEVFAQRLTNDFLYQQSDEWLIEFYGFLNSHGDLWEKPKSILRKKEFIRLDDGSHVCPFRDDGGHNAYLPGSSPSEFSTVKRRLTEDPEALRFLKRLGLAEPELFFEIIEFIVPKYSQTLPAVEAEENIRDLQMVMRALGSQVSGDPEELRAKLRLTLARLGLEDYLQYLSSQSLANPQAWLMLSFGSIPFFRADSFEPTITLYKRAHEIYLDSSGLHDYFDGNANAWYLQSDYPSEIENLCFQFGASKEPRIISKGNDDHGYVSLVKKHGLHKRGVNGFDPDCMVDGLEFALEHINAEKAAYIWNKIAVPNANRIRGIVESSPRQTYANSKKVERLSNMGLLLCGSAWLPVRGAEFRKPEEISMEDLPDTFIRNEALSGRLRMKQNIELLYLATLSDEEKEKISIAKGIPLEVLRRLGREKEGDVEGEVGDNLAGSVEEIDYKEEIEKVFKRPGTGGDFPYVDEPTSMGNPERYRERTAAAIEEARSGEQPVTSKFRRVPRKVWEGKFSETRKFLEEQYAGRCQICDSTFPNREGRPYFEGLYIVHRIRARWLDYQGNVLCLCPTCCAKFQHGALEAEDISQRIETLRTKAEGGSEKLKISIRLCENKENITFSERHLICLQELLRSDK